MTTNDSKLERENLDGTWVLLGNRPALNFLNTLVANEGGITDLLQADTDVLAWLRASGLPAPAKTKHLPPAALLKAARDLREAIRSALRSAKERRMANLSVLNRFMRDQEYYDRLRSDDSGRIRVERVVRSETPAQILSPITQSATNLFADLDFERLKQCEDAQCVLWFYDESKSNRRRWCSMAVCGNRNKVNAYRERLAQKDHSGKNG